MANFRPILVSLLLAGLFMISIITGGITLAYANNANQSIGDDPAIIAYATSLNETLGESITNANSGEEAISSSPITLTSSIPFYDAITGIWKTLKTVPITIWNLTVGLLITRVLGNNFYIVLGVIGAILTITIIFAVWKFVSQGESG